MYTCRTVPTGHVRRVPYHLPGMSKTQAGLWAPMCALQCCGRPQLPYQANTVKPPTCLWTSTVLWASAFTVSGEYGKTPTCLWVSTVWQAPTSAIPEEDDATSHVHLTLTVLWIPTIIIVPDDVGNKT